MTGKLNMNNNKIINLSTDSHNVLSASNVMYVNQVKSGLTDSFDKKINDIGTRAGGGGAGRAAAPSAAKIR